MILDIDDLEDVLYLPLLGSNEPDASAPKPKSKAPLEAPATASIKGTKGLSYPGPQPILSDFPNPTNHIQTLLLPSLHDPYILPQPLLLPNIVRLADAAPVLRAPVPPPVESKFKAPDATAPVARPTAAPQIDVPLSGPAKPLPAPLAESKLKAPDAAAPVARPTAAPQLDVALSGPARPLPAPLAESRLKAPDAATPVARPTAAPQLDVALSGPARPLPAPLAESRLKAPDAATPVARPTAPPPQLDVALPSPLAPATPPPPPKPPETASKPNDPAQDLLSLSPMPGRRDQPVAIPPGEARGRFAISPDPNLDFPGTEPGTKSGSGGSAAPGKMAASAGTADKGVAAPAPATHGPDTNAAKNNGASDSGNRTSSGAGSNVFPGITILGASVDPPTSRNSPSVRNPEPLQTSYGITILSSGRSGGGLPDFGVFKDEQVHTVYLDMRRTVPDTVPSWTVEYALPQAITSPADAPETKVSTQVDVVLPFPIVKEQPAMPADLVRKYPRRMIIVFGVINLDGKMEQLSVKDSPDHLLNEPVLSALKNWTFRPARRNGEVVPAKILLGIPLWTPE